MNRELLAHLPIVVAVARRGGFAAAAAHLGMSPSAVSHAVKTVEDGIGLPLFVRTTRSVAVTEMGAALMASVEPALTAIEETIERVRAAKGKVTGLLRLNAPRVALAIAITPVLAAMASRFPDLTIEVTSDDGLVDIVAGGFDAGVRLGEMIAEDMIAVRLTPPFQAIMVAAPSYLEANGAPKSIADLRKHNCIGFRLVSTGAVYAWDLKDGETDLSVQVAGTARVTDPMYAKELALAGVGIAYVFEPLVRADIGEKRLRWLLPSASVEETGLFLYFPRRAADMPKLRAFIDTSRDVLRIGSRQKGRRANLEI
jgi:DNA-binding transcriptional LysR family regulator